jgi:hypothetical protein
MCGRLWRGGGVHCVPGRPGLYVVTAASQEPRPGNRVDIPPWRSRQGAGVVDAAARGGLRSGYVGHDAVVAAAGSGAAGAGAVAAEHLRGGPAVAFHQVALGAAAVQPGVAEVMPEPVREHLDAALPSPPDDDLIDPAGVKSDELASADPAQVITLLRPCMLSLAARPPFSSTRSGAVSDSG